MKHHVLAVCAVGVLVAGMPAASQAQGLGNGKVQVVFGAGVGYSMPAADSFEDVIVEVDGQDRGELRASHAIEAGPLFDLGGGVIVGPGMYFGAAFSRAMSSAPAMASVEFRHPAFHPTLTDSVTTGDLDHTESSLHLDVGYAIPTSGRLRVIVFGGPTFTSVSRPIVNDLFVDEVFTPPNTFTAVVDNVQTSKLSASGWGYNVGSDVSVMLSKNVGLGGLVRYSGATVRMTQPLRSMWEDDDVTGELKTGGLQVSAGVRLRF